MDFKNLVKEIQEFKGVSRKSSIDNVISLLKESYNVSGDVVIDIGDDASAIDIGNNQVILLAADGIWGDIMNVRWNMGRHNERKPILGRILFCSCKCK